MGTSAAGAGRGQGYVEHCVRPNGDRIVVMDRATYDAVMEKLTEIAGGGFRDRTDPGRVARDAITLLESGL